jgi:hypothetical protein
MRFSDLYIVRISHLPTRVTCPTNLILLGLIILIIRFMGRDPNWVPCSAWKKWIGGTPSEHPPYSPDLTLCDFWAFPTMERELRGKKFGSDQRSAARFREVGGALYEVHRLPREVLRKRDRHRISTKFQLGVIRRVHEFLSNLKSWQCYRIQHEDKYFWLTCKGKFVPLLH